MLGKLFISYTLNLCSFELSKSKIIKLCTESKEMPRDRLGLFQRTSLSPKHKNVPYAPSL